MKPLIVVLLAALSAQAQNLAEFARQERARRAQAPTGRVYTNQDTKGISIASAAPATPEPAKPAPAKPEPEKKAAASKPAAKPAPDIQKMWPAEVAKIRVRIRDLQDQEIALQLQVNESTNQFFTPVTTQAARSQAQASLADAQTRLADVRKELAATRTKLQEMEAQGPPEK